MCKKVKPQQDVIILPIHAYWLGKIRMLPSSFTLFFSSFLSSASFNTKRPNMNSMASVILSVVFQVQYTLISFMRSYLLPLYSLRSHPAYDCFAKGTFSLLISRLNNHSVAQHLQLQFIVCSTLFMYSTIRWVKHTASHLFL